MILRNRILSNLRTASASVALLAATGGISISLAPTLAVAQEHGGGHDSGSQHESSGKGQKGGKGRAPGESSATQGHRSMEDIFQDVAASEEESDRPTWAGIGRRASGEVAGGEDETSDRPDYAGAKGGKNEHGEKPGSAGSKKGDLYGDLYVILRDANGVPILNDAGFVQPIDKDGNLIPLDAEGAPIDPSLTQTVEFSRLSSGRSPNQVLDQRAEEVVTLLSSATAITTDASGRLVVTTPSGTSTIDAPLENLALYVALMTQGTIPGVSDLPGTDYDFLVDGKLTSADLKAATSFLAAAADKYTTISTDTVAYENAILGINPVKVGDVTYSNVNYSTYSYDRSDTYSNQTVTVLVKQTDGSYVPTAVNVYEAVFNNQDYTGTGTLAAFAQAIDDERAVIAFLHDNEVRGE